MNGYTIKEIARGLDTSRQNIYSLIQRKRLKAVKNGYHWHINPAALVDYVTLRLAELEQERKNLQNILKTLAIPIDK